MSFKRLMLTLVCLLPVAALAQRGDRPDRSVGAGGEQRGGDQPKTKPSRAWPARDEVAERAEWEAVQKFFKEKSPERWAAYDSLKAEDGKKMGVRWMMAGRYRMIQETRKAGDVELAEARERRVAVEDKIFGVRKKMIDAGGVESPGARKFQDELKVAVTELVEVHLAERLGNIKRLKRLEEMEEKTHKDELASRDELIQACFKDEMLERPKGILNPPSMHRPPEAGSRKPGADKQGGDKPEKP